MSRIKQRRGKLTAEENATLRAICDKWDWIGLSTAQANREEAEQGAVEFYLACGLNEPKTFFWFDSLAAWTNDKKSKFTIVGPDHRIKPGLENLAHFDWLSSRGTARYFKASFVHRVEDVINESVFCHVVYSPQPAESRLTGYVHHGQRDTAWLAVRDFFTTTKYLGPHKNLTGLMRIVGSCGLFLPGANHEQVAFFERPSAIRLDDRRRLHCLDGPAIQYRDGTGAYIIHGVPVPQKYVETPAEQINLEELLQEENIEVRTAVFSKVGFMQLLNKVPHQVVSRANGNALIEFKMGWQQLRALHLKWEDKTGSKETVIPVPRTRREFGQDFLNGRARVINDCEQVRRWTLGWAKDVEILAET